MFYTLRQNNSGGFFTGPALYLIVEANNEEQAISRSEEAGAYFDSDWDCPCCGPRWSSFYLEESETPVVYGKSISEFLKRTDARPGEGVPEALVFYLDGKKETFN